MANGGTIFLDEIDSIPFSLQVKLLRVIQEREMMPVGSDVPVKLDIRIIAATNKDLKEMVSRGEFRQDLYYRIGVVAINIPPLRERKEDIVQLAREFVDKFNKKYDTDKKLDIKAQKKLMSYSWPGNVRELQNSIERTFLSSPELVLGEDSLRFVFAAEPEKQQASVSAQKTEEANWIRSTLAVCGGDVDAAAEKLGMSRATLYRAIGELVSEGKLKRDGRVFTILPVLEKQRGDV